MKIVRIQTKGKNLEQVKAEIRAHHNTGQQLPPQWDDMINERVHFGREIVIKIIPPFGKKGVLDTDPCRPIWPLYPSELQP